MLSSPSNKSLWGVFFKGAILFLLSLKAARENYPYPDLKLLKIAKENNLGIKCTNNLFHPQIIIMID
jgi:hypothetical protein